VVGAVIGTLIEERLHGGSAPLAVVLLVLVAVVILGGLLGYYGAGRAAIFLMVPAAISMGDESIVGDFRRPGWTGPQVREIRYADVREVGRTRVFRIPVVQGHPDYKRRKAILDSSLFYLSETNLEKVRAAVQSHSAPKIGSLGSTTA
jgi:hypothetical protein